MATVLDKNYIIENNITDFMSDEERAYYSKKLFEAEQYNKEHPKVYSAEEFHKRVKEKYGI